MSTSREEFGLFERADWQAQAACLGVDNALFFPAVHKGTDPSVKLAKAVCARCPVSDECLDYALRNYERHGIWGGLTERERRPLRREVAHTPKPIQHGTDAGYMKHRRRDEDPCAECTWAHRQRNLEKARYVQSTRPSRAKGDSID